MFDYEDDAAFFGNATYEPPADATDLKFTRQYVHSRYAGIDG